MSKQTRREFLDKICNLINSGLDNEEIVINLEATGDWDSEDCVGIIRDFLLTSSVE